jgi:PAS domain-containing protein
VVAEASDNELERRAAELLEGGGLPATGELPSSYITRLIHQLQVHQIELEMQNDELQRAWAVEEEAATKPAEMFELAPIAYVVVAVDGSILAVNEQACVLLNDDQWALVGRDLASFIHRRDHPRWRHSLEVAVSHGAVDRFDVTLTGRDLRGADGVTVQVRMAPSADGAAYRVVLIDP